MILVDSHCHFNLLDQSKPENEVDQVIARAKKNDVQYFLNVSVNIKDFSAVLKVAEQYPFVSASVGLHPNEQSEEIDTDSLVKLGQAQKVIAVGETGLDYFRTKSESPWQQERFRAHIRAAHILQKPLIIHTRQAIDDTLRLMQEENANSISGVMHCFTEDWESAKRALDLNFYISFSGIVTFNNAANIQEVAKRLPLDRMLVETDAPYLAPNPYRGKPNEPSFVRHTAEFIAQLRNTSLDEIAKASTQNFFKLFTGAVQ